MTQAEYVLSVQGKYGSDGWTVFDRRDRWNEEHWFCSKVSHTANVLHGVMVVECKPSFQVLVVGQDAKCTRCLRVIPPQDYGSYLQHEHLCDHCKDVTDTELHARVVASERQSRVVG